MTGQHNGKSLQRLVTESAEAARSSREESTALLDPASPTFPFRIILSALKGFPKGTSINNIISYCVFLATISSCVAGSFINNSNKFRRITFFSIGENVPNIISLEGN